MSAHLSGFLRPIRLTIGRSRRLLWALAFIHCGAAGAALFVALPWWLRVSLLAVVLWSGWRAHSRHLRGDGVAVRELLLRGDGVFEVTTATGIEEASLISADLVEPWLTVLVLRRVSGRKVSVVLLPDNVEADAFRRLRVRLRMPAKADSAAGAGAARDGGS